jgi:ABC-type branched-subunit amino acid transport system substrate-binding protein
MNRRPVVLLVVVGLLLAACGSTVNRATEALAPTSGASGTTPTGEDQPATGTPGTDGTDGTLAPGATVPAGATPGTPTGAATATTVAAGPTSAVPTGPIQLGFMVSTTSNAAAFGGSLPQTVTEEELIRALVARTNAAGGLHGRKIVPVFAKNDSASSNFDADFAAACAKFTEDAHVEAVLGYVSDELAPLESCLTAKRIPHLSATYEPSDAPTLANNYPYLFELASPTLERRTQMKVDGAIAAGLLTPQSRLGVVFAGCPLAIRSWEKVAKPYIESRGITVASVFMTGCPHGAGDVTTEVSKIGNLILQFRSAKVDTLLFHNSDLAALFIIANAAEPQGYRPTYIVSSMAQLQTVGPQIPPTQRVNVHGFGWIPANDVPRSSFPPFPPAASRCLSVLKAGGVSPSTSIDFSKSFYFCDALFLFAEAVDATGGRTDGPSVAAAIEAMGDRHASAVSLDGTSRFGKGRHEGIVSARRIDYRTDCQCFAYGTQTVAVR